MKSTLILLLVSITLVLTAQHSYIPSERIFTTKDGLSSDKIHALHKDSQGFIWIGTESGVDRFDGQSFQNFSKATHPQMTISRVQNILEDKEGYLWLIKENEPFEQSYASTVIQLYNIHTGEWTSLEERFEKDLPFEIKEIEFIEQVSEEVIFIYVADQESAYLYEKERFIPENFGDFSKVKKNA